MRFFEIYKSIHDIKLARRIIILKGYLIRYLLKKLENIFVDFIES